MSEQKDCYFPYLAALCGLPSYMQVKSPHTTDVVMTKTMTMTGIMKTASTWQSKANPASKKSAWCIKSKTPGSSLKGR